jgi:UDP-N-acetylmuramyl pentapeptide synthase
VPLRYTLRDVPSILASPGRWFVIEGALLTYSRPAMSRLARLYRRTAIRRTRVVAVVGSFGKTTTTRAVSLALGTSDQGTTNANFGSGLYLALLRIRPGRRRAVLEVGIQQPGQMRTFAGIIRPNVAVVTGIGTEHGRSFRTLEATREEKAEMVRVLPPDGVAIVNGDDPHVRWMATQTSARVITFGLSSEHDVWADQLQLDWPNGTSFRLHLGGTTRVARTRLLGAHQVRAALAAAATAWVEGVDLDDALARLAELPPTPGRLQPVELANGAIALRDDFKAPIETIDAALDLLAEIPARRKIVVLGLISEPPLGGQHELYRRVGRRVGTIADRFIAVGGQHDYATGARRAGLAPDAITEIRSGCRAIADLLAAELEPGDVVLVKGRSSERLERVVLGLQGRSIGCELDACRVNGSVRCAACPVLERGWRTSRVLP